MEDKIGARVAEAALATVALVAATDVGAAVEPVVLIPEGRLTPLPWAQVLGSWPCKHVEN